MSLDWLQAVANSPVPDHFLETSTGEREREREQLYYYRYSYHYLCKRCPHFGTWAAVLEE